MWTKRESAPRASSRLVRKRDDVVPGGGFDLVDPLRVDARRGP